jgi:RND superfamily putative drug exporter
MPEQRPAQRRGQPQSQTGNEPTTAIPTQRQRDPEATEKIDTHKADEEPKRRGGGVSAADLLRREGRL